MPYAFGQFHTHSGLRGKENWNLGPPCSPARPSLLSHFLHTVLVKKHARYQTGKYFLRNTFLNSMVRFPLCTARSLLPVLSVPEQNTAGCMELCNARPQTSHHLQQLLEIWHLGACKLWLNPTLQNKQSLKKNTRLNPERWQYVCYFGLCYQAACSYAQCTLWKGRNQQQDTQ